MNSNKFPSEPPSFVTTADFQYLQADRIVPKTMYPQASEYISDIGFLGTHGEYTADFFS